jgi:hypothetical protein
VGGGGGVGRGTGVAGSKYSIPLFCSYHLFPVLSSKRNHITPISPEEELVLSELELEVLAELELELREELDVELLVDNEVEELELELVEELKLELLELLELLLLLHHSTINSSGILLYVTNFLMEHSKLLNKSDLPNA